MPTPVPRRLLAAGALALALGAAPAVAVAPRPPAFRAVVTTISPAERAAMTPAVWRPGCPVALSRLRHVSLPFVGFDGRARRGALVVDSSVARDVVEIFRTLYRARFPIRRMRPVEAYRGSDYASIQADNTSSFNCRPATGSRNWSNHAYGVAIDVNPIENPYVSGGTTSHRASRPYLDRSRVRRGMAVEGGTLVRAFDARGWGWGGRWGGSVRDYQHFSPGGR